MCICVCVCVCVCKSSSSLLSTRLLLTILTFRYTGSPYRFGLFSSLSTEVAIQKLIKLKSKMITVNSQGVEVRNSIGKKKSVRKVERAGFEQYSSISTAVLLRKLLLQLRSWVQIIHPVHFFPCWKYGIILRLF